MNDPEDGCPGCNGGTFHEHGGECVRCGADCNQAQQWDLSADPLNSAVVFLCDKCQIKADEPEVEV